MNKAEYKRAWNAKNREKIRLQKKAWYSKNKAHAKQMHDSWCDRHRQHIANYRLKYYWTNKWRWDAYRIKYINENPEISMFSASVLPLHESVPDARLDPCEMLMMKETLTGL